MIIALSGDLHNSGKKLGDISSAWKWAVNKMVEKNTELLLLAGDIFDNSNIGTREGSTGTVFQSFAKPLDHTGIFDHTGIEVAIAEGNHDQAGPGQEGALNPLNLSPRITPVTRPMVRVFGEVAVAFLPWVNKARMMAMEDCKKLTREEQDTLFAGKIHGVLSYLSAELAKYPTLYKILLGHCEVNGSQTPQGYFIPGGSFEFTSSQLESVGADMIALGHIHKRQGYYLGSPWQLSFGEADNPTGIKLIEVVDGKLVGEEWIEPGAPKYHVVKAEEYRAEDYPTGDYVSIRGENLSTQDLFAESNLPAGHVFQKQAERQQIQLRCEASADESPKELLAKWAALNSPSLGMEDLIPALDGLLVGLPAGESSSQVGSLQRIRRITISGLGPHLGTEIVLNGAEMIAVSGPNGCGKTFLLETVLAALFGDFPSRPGSIYDHLTQGKATEGKLELIFDSQGRTFRALRQIRITEKTQKQEAYLFELIGDKEETIAGPKVTDFDREILNLVGSKHLVYASVFASQFGEGDLTVLNPQDRQELFAKWMGLEKFEDISQAAKDRTKELKGANDANLRRIEELQKEELNSSEVQAQVEFQYPHREKVQAIITSLEKQDQILGEQLATFDARDREIGELGERVAEAEKDLNSDQRQLSQINETLAKHEETLKREPAARAAVEELTGLKSQLETLQNAALEKAQAEEAVSRLKSEKQSLENQIRMEEQKRESELKRLEDQAKNLSHKTELLDRAGCKGTMDCPFLVDAKEAQVQQPRINQRMEDLQIELLEKGFAKAILQRIATINTLLNQIQIPEAPGDIAPVRARIEQLGKAEGFLAQLDIVREQISGLEISRDALAVTIEAKEKTLAMLQNRFDEKLALSAGDNGDEKLREQREEVRQQIEQQRTEAGACEYQIGYLEKELAEIKRKREELTRLEAELDKARTEWEIFAALAQAFGRTGIPQIIIDNIRPQIQTILDQLLENLDGRFTISFDTQRVNKGGTIKETLDILVGDEKGTRDISRFSGGEQKLLRTIIRLALGLFQAQRTGNKLEVFFMDEAFDSLDRENAQRLLQILASLKNRFNQVFVVSHSDELILDFPCRIDLSKVNGATKAEVIGT